MRRGSSSVKFKLTNGVHRVGKRLFIESAIQCSRIEIVQSCVRSILSVREGYSIKKGHESKALRKCVTVTKSGSSPMHLSATVCLTVSAVCSLVMCHTAPCYRDYHSIKCTLPATKRCTWTSEQEERLLVSMARGTVCTNDQINKSQSNESFRDDKTMCIVYYCVV